MRLANSPDTSSCLSEGLSPVFDTETVGNAISSLTPGSSMASVAGKKRLPTISCARAVVADAVSPTPSMARGHEFLNMGNSNIAMTEKTSRAETRQRRQAILGGPLARPGSPTTASCRRLSMGGATADSGDGVTEAGDVVPGGNRGADALQRLQ